MTLKVLIIVRFSLFVLPRLNEMSKEFFIEIKGNFYISDLDTLTCSGRLIVIDPIIVKSDITGRYILMV